MDGKPGIRIRHAGGRRDGTGRTASGHLPVRRHPRSASTAWVIGPTAARRPQGTACAHPGVRRPPDGGMSCLALMSAIRIALRSAPPRAQLPKYNSRGIPGSIGEHTYDQIRTCRHPAFLQRTHTQGRNRGRAQPQPDGHGGADGPRRDIDPLHRRRVRGGNHEHPGGRHGGGDPQGRGALHRPGHALRGGGRGCDHELRHRGLLRGAGTPGAHGQAPGHLHEPAHPQLHGPGLQQRAHGHLHRQHPPRRPGGRRPRRRPGGHQPRTVQRQPLRGGHRGQHLRQRRHGHGGMAREGPQAQAGGGGHRTAGGRRGGTGTRCRRKPPRP